MKGVKMRNPSRLLSAGLAFGLLVSLTAGCGKARQAYHLQRADKYFAAGQYPHAEVEYLISLRGGGENAHAISRLGTIYYEEGRFPQAFRFVTRASALAPNDMDLHLK